MYQQKHGRPRIYWPKANSIYGQQKSYIPDRGWFLLVEIRGQRDFSIPGILDKSQLHFFSLDHEKWISEVSISSRNMRVTKWNLVLVSKYENGHMIISISSRQARARKIILNLVSKNCTFSREWEWDSKSKPITKLHSRQSETKWYDFWKIIRKMHEKLRWLLFVPWKCLAAKQNSTKLVDYFEFTFQLAINLRLDGQ